MRIFIIVFILSICFTLTAQNTYIPTITKDDVFVQRVLETKSIPDSLIMVDDLEYVLQRGDHISIFVMDHDEFTKQKILILPDGRIEYPLLGSIRVAGLTSRTLSEIIKEKLRPYVTIPVVTIYIDAIYGQKINIIGYVNSPGEFQIYEPIRIADALALARGIKNIREVSTIRIIRDDGDVFNVSLKKIWFSKSDNLVLEDQILIYPGDSILVPPPKEFDWRLYSAILTTIILGLQLYLAFK